MKFLPLSALVAFQALLANAAVAPGRSLASTTELSNGAEVTINITSPYMFQNFTNIVNTTMAFNGTASVGKGIADVAYIYIIDESGSMDEADAPCDTTNLPTDNLKPPNMQQPQPSRPSSNASPSTPATQRRSSRSVGGAW